MSEFGPSFYGEVLPTSSRAVDDEEDEEDADIDMFSSCVLRWSPTALSEIEKAGRVTCNVLIISIDRVATSFIQTHFLHRETERIGAICSGLQSESKSSLNQEDFFDETCYIYRLVDEPSVLLCQCNIKVQPELAYSWVQQLFSKATNEHTYISILTHRSINDLKCEVPCSELKTPLLKALKSSHYKGTAVCDYLEQPSIVDGLLAEILTYCQVMGLPAIAYICYMENLYMDMNSASEFNKIVKSTPFKDVYKVNPNACKELRALVDRHNVTNTLYL